MGPPAVTHCIAPPTAAAITPAVHLPAHRLQEVEDVLPRNHGHEQSDDGGVERNQDDAESVLWEEHRVGASETRHALHIVYCTNTWRDA